MEQTKTVNWKHVQYCKYNTNPHFVMLTDQLVRATKARLVGQQRHEDTRWYEVVYDREYLIQYIIIRLLMPLGVKDKEPVDKLINEAWDEYLKLASAASSNNQADQATLLFAANEINHETK